MTRVIEIFTRDKEIAIQMFRIKSNQRQKRRRKDAEAKRAKFNSRGENVKKKCLRHKREYIILQTGMFVHAYDHTNQ